MTSALYKRKEFKYIKLIKSRKDFKNQIMQRYLELNIWWPSLETSVIIYTHTKIEIYMFILYIYIYTHTHIKIELYTFHICKIILYMLFFYFDSLRKSWLSTLDVQGPILSMLHQLELGETWPWPRIHRAWNGKFRIALHEMPVCSSNWPWALLIVWKQF